jgi:hypothetical protein
MSVGHYTCCTCIGCCNDKKTSNIEKICEHLMVRGFMSGYICWTKHDEHKVVVHEGHPTVEED